MEAAQILIIICGIVACLACATRFYLRVIVKKRAEFVEFILIIAAVMLLTLIGVQMRIFELIPTIQSPSSFVEAQKLFFSGTFFYLASLWAIKISINFLHIQLTRGFERIRFLAVCNLYFLIGILPFMYTIYFFACWPLERRWALPSGRQCKPMIHGWDFWTHLMIHFVTDITLCIIPFPALLKVTERRLRIAICFVYSIAFIAIIVSIVRIVLLATDVQRSIKKIMVLTTIEVTVCLVVAILPGISSAFTKKYAQGNKSTFSKKSKRRELNKPTFVPLSGHDAPIAKDNGDANTMELCELGHHAVGFAEQGGYRNRPSSSTDEVIDTAKGGITMTTDVTIAREKR